MKIIKKSLFTPNSLLLTMIILGFCHYYLVFVCYLDSSAIGSQGFVLVLAFTGKNERNKDK